MFGIKNKVRTTLDVTLLKIRSYKLKSSWRKCVNIKNQQIVKKDERSSFNLKSLNSNVLFKFKNSLTYLYIFNYVVNIAVSVGIKKLFTKYRYMEMLQA